MTKTQFKRHIKTCLINAHKAALRDIDKVISSGCVDVENSSCMIVPKAIAAALLEREAGQLTPPGGLWKEFNSTKRNASYFI